MKLFNVFKRNMITGVRGKRPERGHARRLKLEVLEDRRVLATFLVDDNLVDCPQAQFTSIQAAVNAADDGDNIIVCKGTYTEQVTIGPTKDDLELRAKNTLQAIIQAPPGVVTPAIVHVNGAEDVKIIGFTITGPMAIPASSPPIQAGIFVGNGGSAKIERNHITKIRNEPLNSSDNGVAILIGQESTGQTGEAEIRRNRIDEYQRAGIVVDNVGSDAEIEDNEIIGVGPTSAIAQIGVQISDGATGEVENNKISGNQFTLPTAAGAGVVLSDSGRTKIKNNEIEDNDVGIEVLNVDQKTEISHNEIEDSTDVGIGLFQSTKIEVKNNEVEDSGFEGLFVESSNKNTISNNKFTRNGNSGIVLLFSNQNRVQDNELVRNGLDGILVEHSNENRITDNKAERNGRDGFRVVGTSSNNRLTSNKAKRNTEHDCHDDTFGTGTAGTANIWKNNDGKTENRSGLCDD